MVSWTPGATEMQEGSYGFGNSLTKKMSLGIKNQIDKRDGSATDNLLCFPPVCEVPYEYSGLIWSVFSNSWSFFCFSDKTESGAVLTVSMQEKLREVIGWMISPPTDIPRFYFLAFVFHQKLLSSHAVIDSPIENWINATFKLPRWQSAGAWELCDGELSLWRVLNMCSVI